MTMTNHLLEMDGLPAFSAITPEMIEPAIDQLLEENRAEIKRLLNTQQTHTWKNLIEPLEMLDDRLSKVWSPVSHMNSVINSDTLRKDYNACLPKLSDYATEMGQNTELCDAYKAV
ncbi:MAG: oligopeptidase A, partial [Candidatus Thiodiazotropha sp. (ex Semelilucina semeliformis)]|nr:oligopeptidase A [Candidatus Thiodiazotropha sp. (ex Semelilucina semeliformis)]